MNISNAKDMENRCSGCTACANICPVEAITMQEGKEGFLYPIVKNKCIDCNKCIQYCPVIKPEPLKEPEFVRKAYVGYHKSADVREKSASGGIFTGIAQDILDRNGVVYGVAYTKDFRAEHIRITEKHQLKALQKSKYIQSQIGSIYKSIQNDLEDGILVLFSGTPCQIAGLRNFLRKKYNNLICMDFECHGISNYKVLRKAITLWEQKYNKKVVQFTMRYKKMYRYCYDTGVCVEFENGHKAFFQHYEEPFSRLFFGNIALRKSCYNCQFKTVMRNSDITMGDSWFSELQTGKTGMDSCGVSKIIAQSRKGEQLLDGSTYIEKYPVNIDELLKVNGNMMTMSAVDKPGKRDYFFEHLETDEFKNLVNKCSANVNKSKFIKLLKRLIVNTKWFSKYRKKQNQKQYLGRLMK